MDDVRISFPYDAGLVAVRRLSAPGARWLAGEKAWLMQPVEARSFLAAAKAHMLKGNQRFHIMWDGEPAPMNGGPPRVAPRVECRHVGPVCVRVTDDGASQTVEVTRRGMADFDRCELRALDGVPGLRRDGGRDYYVGRGAALAAEAVAALEAIPEFA